MVCDGIVTVESASYSGKKRTDTTRVKKLYFRALYTLDMKFIGIR